jgi:hypothetical protein
VRSLAERIKKSFQDFRILLRKYELNIEVVDPQLKNNSELVEVLAEFENSWTQGLTYLMDPKKFHQLLHFSQVIEATAEKHKAFSEMLEQRDSEIFFIIPSLLILKSLENDDKEICNFFYPDMFEATNKQGLTLIKLKAEYEVGRLKLGNDYDFYNIVEKCLLEIDLKDKDRRWEEELGIKIKIIREIKGLAMCLSRFKPADWNKFLDVVIK